ncbi:hypothetical protein [Gordonia sp. N1V]|uniref:hypothetical protein n=1 Tax=Gordonia sp. N1V TaxID=3034163 RepID=UPI0023E12CA6|nr:hypothetical protein [Gordonia sp. N1V]MDF3285001.1 hypothetical protein [Gordonia sp. N1V]
MSTAQGQISIQYHQFTFQVGDGSAAGFDPVDNVGLLLSMRNLLAVRSVVDTVTSMLVIERTVSRPDLFDLDEWDACSELSFEFVEAGRLAVTYQPAGVGMDAELAGFLIDPGLYRVRAYGRRAGGTVVPKSEQDLLNDGSYDEADPALDRVLEDLRVQLWREQEPRPGVVHKSDAAYTFPVSHEQ